MSKFADKLGRIYKTAAPAIGFRKPAEEAELPALLLIADVAKTGAKKTKGVVDSGIDAAVVSSEAFDTASAKELAASMNNTPLGLLLEKESSQEKIQELVALQWDFVVFDLQTPLEAINKEGLGKILKIEPSLAPGLVRAINDLSFDIDAVLIAGENSVTFECLLTCQFLSSVINKPLLIHGNSSLTSNELNNLREAGIKGLILPEGTLPKAVAELKKLIGNLPKTPRRKAKASSALLPHIVPETRVEKEGEEEEEDI